MKKIIMLVIVPVLIGGIFCYRSAVFAEHTGPGRYSNEDLEKYETPGNTAGKPAPNVSDKEKSRDGETQERENWCSQGTALNRTISEAKKEIDVILDKFPEKKGEDIDTMELSDGVLQERLNMNRRKLREAESALRDLEEQAYRKGVPPGWVRCNFEK
jgi:hypothetical protein